MNVVTVRKGTKHLTMSEMPLKARVILLGMRGNPHFPGLDPLLDTLEQRADAMTAANIACLDGGRLVTAHRKRCRKELDRVLDQLVNYVRAMSGRDATVALSSGFELRNPPLQLPKPGQPENLRVDVPAGGHLDLRWEPMHGVRQYVVFKNIHGPAVEEAWEPLAYSSAAKLSVTKLEPATVMWFRLLALNASGAGPWSQVVRGMAY